MELKQISKSAVAHALGLGERYRLLNEPDQAASICRDILAIDPENQEASRMLLLALTDQFGRSQGVTLSECERIASGLRSDYDQAYYAGVAYERWGRSLLRHAQTPKRAAGEWIAKAMEKYQQAETLRSPDNDDSLLRWNTCVRLIERFPELQPETGDDQHLFGD